MGTTQALIFELNSRIGKEEKTWKFGKGNNDLRFPVIFLSRQGGEIYRYLGGYIYAHVNGKGRGGEGRSLKIQ